MTLPSSHCFERKLQFPRIKYFRDEGCLSYILFDLKTREGLCIDPCGEQLENYQDYLREHQIKLLWIVDTHTHADHLSCSHSLRAEFKSVIIMQSETGSERVTRRVKSGDTLPFGSHVAEIIATPGHTPDSLCVKVGTLLFTGDLLLIGSTGRTDFPGSDPKKSFQSLKALSQFPKATVVYPGHDYQQRLFSTIGAEFENNPELRLSEERYVDHKKNEVLYTAGAKIGAIVKANLALDPSLSVQCNQDNSQCSDQAGRAGQAPVKTSCGTVQKDLPAIAAISVEKYALRLAEQSKSQTHSAFIDVREPEEFALGHMPGVSSIPMAELGFYLDDFKNFARIYVSCRSGVRSAICTRSLENLGFKDVVNVTGGFTAWEAAGLKIEKP